MITRSSFLYMAMTIFLWRSNSFCRCTYQTARDFLSHSRWVDLVEDHLVRNPYAAPMHRDVMTRQPTNSATRENRSTHRRQDKKIYCPTNGHPRPRFLSRNACAGAHPKAVPAGPGTWCQSRESGFNYHCLFLMWVCACTVAWAR